LGDLGHDPKARAERHNERGVSQVKNPSIIAYAQYGKCGKQGKDAEMYDFIFIMHPVERDQTTGHIEEGTKDNGPQDRYRPYDAIPVAEYFFVKKSGKRPNAFG
jgi:hypothetical protein